MPSCNSELWTQLENFSLGDEPNRPVFTWRLARENAWSLEFPRRVVFEYRRFLFLAAHAGHPVSPSQAVDEAWHLHLIHTVSYWNDLCHDILKFPLHHHPSDGGLEESAKFKEWYANTLASYRLHFQAEPPSDIWPTDNISRSSLPAKSSLLRRRLPSQISHFVERATKSPRIWGQSWVKLGERVAPTSLLLVPLCFVGGCQLVKGGVLDWRGPDFLAFYAATSVFSLSLLGLVRWAMRSPGDPCHDSELPKDPYEIALLSGGIESALNAALVSLHERDLVQIEGGATPTAKPKDRSPPDRMPVLEARLWKRISESGGVSVRSLKETAKMALQKKQELLTDRGFLTTTVSSAISVAISLLVLSGLLTLGGMKVWIGWGRGRPVSFLMLEMLAVAVVGLAIALVSRWRTRRGDLAVKSLQTVHAPLKNLAETNFDLSNPQPGQVAIAVGLYGLTCLEETSYAHIQRQLAPVTSTGNGGSGCGASSCGGGGGGGGGGGCGGCGGCSG